MYTLPKALRQKLPPQGIDLIQEFPLSKLTSLAWSPPDLPTKGTGWVIGNTGALWSHWARVMRADPLRQTQANPLDQWITEVITDLVKQHDPEAQIYWAHQTEPAPIPIQRIAQLSGLASLSPAHLCAHPKYGPWIGLRALVVSTAHEPSLAEPPASRVEPCASCKDKMCGLAWNDAQIDARRASGKITAQSVRDTWRSWVAIREACPVGRQYQYSTAQLRYHYLQDRDAWQEDH